MKGFFVADLSSAALCEGGSRRTLGRLFSAFFIPHPSPFFPPELYAQEGIVLDLIGLTSGEGPFRHPAALRSNSRRPMGWGGWGDTSGDFDRRGLRPDWDDRGKRPLWLPRGGVG